MEALAALLAALVGYHAVAVAVAMHRVAPLFASFRATGLPAGFDARRVDMLVRVQDPGFRTHRGVEWPRPLTTTTITQSLVKLLFFERFRPGWHKLEQTLIAAWVVDPAVPKDVQIAAFVGIAYLGHQGGQAVTGFAAAGRHWFGKPLAELGDDEFLALVAMLPAPNHFLPGSPASRERVERIKRLLAGACSHQSIAGIQLDQCRGR